MTNKQNDQLFNSIFGEVEPFKGTMELNGKTYKIKGYGTPPIKGSITGNAIITVKKGKG